MRATDWDEYGFTWAFDSPDEARAWIRGLMAVDGDLELVCRIHDETWTPVCPGDELCGLCEREGRADVRMTDLGAEAWCFMPPGERFPDGGGAA